MDNLSGCAAADKSKESAAYALGQNLGGGAGHDQVCHMVHLPE